MLALEMGVSLRASNFPRRGDDDVVSLRNSQFKQFDYEYAANLKESHPDIWNAGGNIRGDEAFQHWSKVRANGGRPETTAQEDWVREREAWMARHEKDGSQFGDGSLEPTLSNVAGIIAVIKWGGVCTIGEGKMKSVINRLKRKRDARSVSARGFCPTGEGGGVDNSCNSNEGGGKSDAPKDEPKKEEPWPADRRGKWELGNKADIIPLGDRKNYRDLLAALQEPDGGFTWEGLQGREVVGTSKIVSPYAGRSKVFDKIEDVKATDIADFAIKNFDLLMKPYHFVGGWHDKQSKKVFLDISIVAATAKEAERLSRENDQIAYFDLETGKSVDVDRNAKSGQRSAANGRQANALRQRAGRQADAGDDRRVLQGTHGQGRNGRREEGDSEEVGRPRVATEGPVAFSIGLSLARLRAFCATGEGGGIDNSCSASDGDGTSESVGPGRERRGNQEFDTSGPVERLITNDKPLKTQGPSQDSDLDTYRNDELKSTRAPIPIGEITETESGEIKLKFANKDAQTSYEKTTKDFGVSMKSIVKNYEELLLKSDPRDADWYHERFNETKEYAKETGLDQRVVAAVVAATSPRITWSDPQMTGIQVTKGWEKAGDAPEGVTRFPNMKLAKGVMEFMRRDTPMMYKGRMTRPSEKDKQGNFIIPAKDLFNRTGYKGGHPDAPGGLSGNLVKAAQILRGEKSIDDALGTSGTSMKVRSFYTNIIRPWGSKNVTIDALMCQATGAKKWPMKDGKPQYEQISDGAYRYSMLAGAVTHLAKKYNMKPHEVQARIWMQFRKTNSTVAKVKKTRARLKAAAKAKAPRKGKKK